MTSRKSLLLISAICLAGVLVALTIGPSAGQQGQGNNLGNHHSELTFELAPGESDSFVIPKTHVPVRVDVSFHNIVTQTSETTTDHPYPFSGSFTAIREPESAQGW